jgi:hypothetical protein
MAGFFPCKYKGYRWPFFEIEMAPKHIRAERAYVFQAIGMNKNS